MPVTEGMHCALGVIDSGGVQQMCAHLRDAVHVVFHRHEARLELRDGRHVPREHTLHARKKYRVKFLAQTSVRHAAALKVCTVTGRAYTGL